MSDEGFVTLYFWNPKQKSIIVSPGWVLFGDPPRYRKKSDSDSGRERYRLVSGDGSTDYQFPWSTSPKKLIEALVADGREKVKALEEQIAKLQRQRTKLMLDCVALASNQVPMVQEGEGGDWT